MSHRNELPQGAPPLKFLIVEDDPNLRLLWKTVLADRGHDVTEADTVEAARTQLAAGRFEAMILDLYLGRENGMSLAAVTDDLSPGCRIIIVTGAADVDESDVFGCAVGIVSVHRKPVDIEDLLAACQRLEGLPQQRASG